MERLLARRAEFVAFVQKRVGRRDLAEDVVQEALTKSVARLAEVQEDAVVAWFYQVLRNAIVDHVRKEATAARTRDGLQAETAVAFLPPEEERRPCCCASRLLDELKPEYADAVRRIDVQDVPVKDYAQKAGITSGNAAVRVFRARESLRKAVARTCGDCCAGGGHHFCTCPDPVGA